MPPLRCHLLIGPPASGKSTVALALQELLARGGPTPVLISTDAIREELYGDPAVQGPWHEIREVMESRLREAVATSVPVIVDATHANRASRLAITQALVLPSPVEWVGWWLTTPLETCLEWNSKRAVPVPESVIHEYHESLQSSFGPSNDEGLAGLQKLDPSALPIDRLPPRLSGMLETHDNSIKNTRIRTGHYELHRYSRLLDMERILYLIRLLSRFPDLEATDEQTTIEMLKLCNPLPTSSNPAERAAAFLRHHGDCYADAEALSADLSWLDEQGFMEGSAVRTQLEPPEADERVRICLGGRPPTADKRAFTRIMTLLRHILQNPLDADRSSVHDENRSISMPVHVHLVRQMEGIEGGYTDGPIRNQGGRWQCGESQTLHKDVTMLKRYGLFSEKAARHGYFLGTALLPLSRLLELNAVVRQVAHRQNDPTVNDLRDDFNQRLGWAGYPTDERPPVRAYANRSIVKRENAPLGSLAAAQDADRLSEAILNGYPVQLQDDPSAARFEGQQPNTNKFKVWPLQLVFHNIGWYLAYEEWLDNAPGLIKTQRLDRLRLVEVDKDPQHNRSIDDHRNSERRLKQLLDYCGGIFFGYDLDAQLDLCGGNRVRRKKHLVTLRFRCMDWVFKFLREGVQRFPRHCTRLSKPLPGDLWRHRPNIAKDKDTLATLDPIPGDTHPYPVEFDLPYWTIGTGLRDGDVDLKRWLFGFDGGIVIEAPQAFLERRLWSAREVLRVHGQAANSGG